MLSYLCFRFFSLGYISYCAHACWLSLIGKQSNSDFHWDTTTVLGNHHEFIQVRDILSLHAVGVSFGSQLLVFWGNVLDEGGIDELFKRVSKGFAQCCIDMLQEVVLHKYHSVLTVLNQFFILFSQSPLFGHIMLVSDNALYLGIMKKIIHSIVQCDVGPIFVSNTEVSAEGFTRVLQDLGKKLRSMRDIVRMNNIQSRLPNTLLG